MSNLKCKTKLTSANRDLETSGARSLALKSSPRSTLVLPVKLDMVALALLSAAALAPAVAAVVVDTLPMDPQDLLVQMEKPVEMANPVNLVTMVLLDKQRLHNQNHNGASTAHPDQLDQPETPVALDNPVDLDNLDLLLLVADKAHPAHLDLLDLLVDPVNLVDPANLVNPVKSTKFPAQKDHPAQLAHLDNLATTDNLEAQATQEAPVNPDPLEMLEETEHPEPPATLVALETMENLVATVVATIAHLHVLLPDIKHHIQLSQTSFQEYPHTTNNLFNFVLLFVQTLEFYSKHFGIRKFD